MTESRALKALRGTKSQLEAVDGEESLTQLYSKALHDIEHKRAMHNRTEGKKKTCTEYGTSKVINDIRDLNEAYQYFKKKYKEKWRKKIEMEEANEGKDHKENLT